MSSVNIGESIKLALFGESHGPFIGGVVDGFPYGFSINMTELKDFIKRRTPGNSNFVTQRKEQDELIFLSGIKDSVIMGDPLAIIIKNENADSSAYNDLLNRPRPSHVDYAAIKKYGQFIDLNGGGHFSGRVTAVVTAFGGIAKQILESQNIYVFAHLLRIMDVIDIGHDEIDDISVFRVSDINRYSIINEKNVDRIDKLINKLKKEGESIGGIVECSIIGLSAGIGEPIFNGIESNISKLVFSIPGVKGIEFGSGFDGAMKLGSENNDEFYIDENKRIKTFTNNSGGILGGISNGMPINFKVAFKPTPSIKKTQRTVDLTKNEQITINIGGRHDPCIAIRGVAVVEAITALVILDYIKAKLKF